MTVITWQRSSQLCEHETRHAEKQKAEGAETTPEAKADDLKMNQQWAMDVIPATIFELDMFRDPGC